MTDDFSIPDVIGDVVAWRAWEIVGDVHFVRLQSATQSAGADTIWPTNRWYEGKCLVHRHEPAEVPASNCSCGIYAAKTLAQLTQLSYASWYDVPNSAVGEIVYAGRVIEGSQGWKGQRARIRRLWVPTRAWEIAKPLGEAYGVEVGIFTGGATNEPLRLLSREEVS